MLVPAAVVLGLAAVPGAPTAGTFAAAPVASAEASGPVPGGARRPGPAVIAIQLEPHSPQYLLTAYTWRHRYHHRGPAWRRHRYHHRGPAWRRPRYHHRTPRQIARAMARRFHWGPWQFRFLNRLWKHESSWDPRAANPYSGAYGIPQADPGFKMASAGPGWRWNARTQIRWGLRYIRERYGSPRRAWSHECWYGWY
jgi:hypothetical protein